MERRQGGETSGHEARRRTLASRSSSREACSSSRVRCSVSRMRRSSSCSSSSREEEGSVCTSTVTRPAAGPNGLSGLNGGGGGKDAGSGSAGRSRSSSLAFLSRSRESSSCCRVSRSSACIARKSASVTREGGLAAIMAIDRRSGGHLRARALVASSHLASSFQMEYTEIEVPRVFHRPASCKTAQHSIKPLWCSRPARDLRFPARAATERGAAKQPLRRAPPVGSPSLPVPPLRRPLAPCPGGSAEPLVLARPRRVRTAQGCCVN